VPRYLWLPKKHAYLELLTRAEAGAARRKPKPVKRRASRAQVTLETLPLLGRWGSIQDAWDYITEQDKEEN
jgi:hypothetical protein